MSIAWLLSALTYLALVVLVAGVALRIAKYARAPLHLRWELYPIPHEKGRAHGGSYFEETDWWTRPRETSLAHEISAMLEEILLIRSLWHRNRAHWYASFPFHLGLYLLVGLAGLLIAGAAAKAVFGPGVPALGAVKGVASLLTVLVGGAGLLLAALGTVALLWRRLTDSELKGASTFADYFNLAFLLVAFLSAGFAWLTVDGSFVHLREYLRGLLTLSPGAGMPGAVAVEVALFSAFLIYLPFTHMTHFVAKYFTYHQVRWDDSPNVNDPAMVARMQANLARPVGWAGPHIQAEKSWAEVATEVKQ